VNNIHYSSEKQTEIPFKGWGYVSFIDDLSQLLPAPAPQNADDLVNAWKANWQEIKTSEKSTEAVSDQIDKSRTDILKILMQLK
jgi:hypothetical protein